MTTTPKKSTAFLDGYCARILAAVCLVAAVTVMVHLNRAEIFSDQAKTKVAGLLPAYTSCRDGEYAKLAKWAKNNPDKWKPEVLIKAKQAANTMCIKKSSSKSRTN